MRELPPEQAAITVSRRNWLRLAPLVLLMVVVVVLVVVGLYAKANPAVTPYAEYSQSAAQSASGSACVPDRSAALDPASQPWSAERRSESEAVWAANTADPAATNYLLGPGGWAFFGDLYVENASQMVGRVSPNSGEIERFRQRMTALQKQLASQGATLVIMVGSANWDVYPEQTPEWTRDITGATPLDFLQASTSELPWIDARAALRDAAEPTYAALNSHWTDYGAYVAWQHAAGCLPSLAGREFDGAQAPALAGVDTANKPDLNEFAVYGVGSGEPMDWTVPRFDSELPDVTLTASDGSVSQVPGATTLDMTTYPVTVTNPQAAVQRNVLVVGDSMARSLSPFITQAFSSASFITNDLDTGALPDIGAAAAEYNSQLVVVEVAERYFPTMWR